MKYHLIKRNSGGKHREQQSNLSWRNLIKTVYCLPVTSNKHIIPLLWLKLLTGSLKDTGTKEDFH